MKNTDGAYNGQRSWGRGFLKNLVAKREKDAANGPINDGIWTALLAKALDDGPPNNYSALALEMFIVQKCLNEGCGKNTAEGISSAFAALWDNTCGSGPLHMHGRYESKLGVSGPSV